MIQFTVLDLTTYAATSLPSLSIEVPRITYVLSIICRASTDKTFAIFAIIFTVDESVDKDLL